MPKVSDGRPHYLVINADEGMLTAEVRCVDLD